MLKLENSDTEKQVKKNLSSPNRDLSYFLNTEAFAYLSLWQQKLIRVSVQLYEQREKLGDLEDFSFMIFSASKAYEGLLKKILLDLSLLDKKTYKSRRFRIGRALNPDVRVDQRDKYWLYDDLARIVGEETARQMWQSWLRCRNHVFHFFPGKEELMDLEEAEACIASLFETISNLIEATGVSQKKPASF